MKIAIHHGGEEGCIRYHKGSKEVMVTHPNEQVRNTIHHYLSTPRYFKVGNPPDANGDPAGYNLLEMTPKDKPEHMMTALSEMSFHTGVGVNWGHEENIFPKLGKPIKPSESKEIIKSIDDKIDYDLI